MSESAPMRVVQIISAPAAGGAEVYVKDLAFALMKAGHKVMIVFLDHAADVGRDESYEHGFLTDLLAGGVEFEFIGHQARRNPLFGWRRLRTLVRRWSPDVVHSHLFYGVLFSALGRVPVVYTHHSIQLRLPAIFYKFFLDRVVHTYVGICGACTRVLEKATAKPVVRIDNGVNPERILPRVESDASIPARLIAIGQLTHHKNYSLLLDVLHQLRDLQWTLEIAGEGPERSLIVRKIEEFGLKNRVDLLGNVSDVARRLASADIFVMSSVSEGLPIAMIEATLAGLPVVVTNVGGCAEVVHDVANGFVVDGGDIRGFAVALRRLIEDEAQRNFFAGNARRYSSRYKLETAAAKHENLYRQIRVMHVA